MESASPVKALAPAPDAVLRALARSDGLRVRLSWSDASGGRMVARGTGRVRVERPGPGALITREEGFWITDGGGPVRFRTVTRWTVGDGAVHVAHLRRGPEQPVPLVALVPRGGDLVSAEAYRCGDDLYRGALRLRNDGTVTLLWTVRGPVKDQGLVFRYGGHPSTNGASVHGGGERVAPDAAP